MANVLIHGKTPENVTQALKCDEDGNLITSPLGGVISNYALETGGNLESINTGIGAVETAINGKHLNSATDSVSVNVISGFALEDGGNLESINTGIGAVETAITGKHLNSATDSVSVNVISGFALETGGNLENINDNVKSINAITYLEDGYSSILLENGSAVYADSVPTPIVDSNKRAGWYYINVEAGNKCNYYFLDGTQETFTLANLVYMYAKISIDNFANDVQNLPFLTVYTKPTGSGDAGAFYHSKITYTMTNNTQKIGVGEEVFFFAKAIPTNQWFKNRIIRDDEIIIVGEALPTEEILFMSLGTDSGASPLGVRLLVQELGFSMGQVNRKVSLVGYNANDVIPSKIDETNGKLDTINTTITDKHLNSGTDSVSVNLITGFALEEGGNLESIKNKTDTLTFHSFEDIDRLYTYDDIQNGKLDTINTTITDKHLNEATDSVSVNLITNYATETGGNLEGIKNKTDTLTFHSFEDIDRLYTYDDIQNGKLDTINTTITDKHLNSATDSVSVNVISGFALEDGGNLESINSNISNVYTELLTTNTKLDTSNTNTGNLNNMVFGGSNQTLPTTSTLQNVLIMGFHEGHGGGGTSDLHPVSLNENGHISCNITSIEANESLNCNITNPSIAVTTSKTYSGPLTIFDVAGNQSSYTATSVDYDGDIVSLDGYDKFLLLCSLTAVVSNPGTFQILVSYDNITYYGLQTTSFNTEGNNLVAYPYYRLNGLFDNAKIVIGSGFGNGYNGNNTTPFDSFGYKYLKVRMNITGTSSNITNPYFEIIRLN